MLCSYCKKTNKKLVYTEITTEIFLNHGDMQLQYAYVIFKFSVERERESNSVCLFLCACVCVHVLYLPLILLHVLFCFQEIDFVSVINKSEVSTLTPIRGFTMLVMVGPTLLLVSCQC